MSREALHPCAVVLYHSSSVSVGVRQGVVTLQLVGLNLGDRKSTLGFLYLSYLCKLKLSVRGKTVDILG